MQFRQRRLLSGDPFLEKLFNEVIRRSASSTKEGVSSQLPYPMIDTTGMPREETVQPVLPGPQDLDQYREFLATRK